MRLDKIDKWRQKLAGLLLRIGNIRATELIKIAESLGRRKIKSKSKHKMYETDLPWRPPFSISGHPGNIDKGWAKGIIGQLEIDLDVHEKLERKRLEELKRGNGHA